MDERVSRLSVRILVDPLSSTLSTALFPCELSLIAAFNLVYRELRATAPYFLYHFYISFHFVVFTLFRFYKEFLSSRSLPLRHLTNTHLEKCTPQVSTTAVEQREHYRTLVSLVRYHVFFRHQYMF